MQLLVRSSDKVSPLSLVGGKGYNLLKLINADIPVPDFFILTTDSYDLFTKTYQLDKFLDEINFNSSQIDISQTSKRIRSEFEKYELPEELKNLIQEAYEEINSPLSVRSSATVEDLPNLSFAGQHDTFLNVTNIEELFVSIVKCFSSLWTERAISYRVKNKVNNNNIKLATVVQKMILSEASGVMFTANPITGNRNQTIIEAVLGFGEALVSGIVEPDTYTFTHSGEIVEKKIRTQKLKISGDETGTKTEKINASEQKVSDKTAIRLIEFGNNISKLYDNDPQDVEWVVINLNSNPKIYIVQSRAITSLYPLPNHLLNKQGLMYISINAVQGVLDPFTNLGADVFSGFILHIGEAIMHRKISEKQTVIVSIGYRIWANVFPAIKTKPFDSLIKKFATVAEPETLKIINEIEIEDPDLKQKNKVSINSFLITFRTFLNILHKIIRLQRNPRKEMIRIMKKIDLLEVDIRESSQQVTDLSSLHEFLTNAEKKTAQGLFLSLIPVVATGFMDVTIYSKLVKRVNPEIEPSKLLVALPNNPTTQMNLRLWYVHLEIVSDRDSQNYLENKSVSKLKELYETKALPPVFQSVLENFLDGYGFRGNFEIDIGQERWSENPEIIFHILKTYLTIDRDMDPQDKFNSDRLKVQNNIKNDIQMLQKRKGGSVLASLSLALVKRFRFLAGLREYPKFRIVGILTIVRQTVLRIGEDLVKQKLLETKNDLFFLSKKELKHFAGDLENIMERIKKNKIDYEIEKHRTVIPRILMGNGEALQFAKQNVTSDSKTLIGSPAAAGKYTGEVKVMLKPNDGGLKNGQILVCPATDPAWTPLFQVAKGLIMEVGGMMTHGSVVARETGIPAVVGVPNATIKLKDGMKVEVNGSNGIIRILD